MMSDPGQASKQPPACGGVSDATPLDPRLLKTGPAVLGAGLVDEILGDHGPQHPGGETCKRCGFAYHPDAADCPSVIFVLALRAAEVPG